MKTTRRIEKASENRRTCPCRNSPSNAVSGPSLSRGHAEKRGFEETVEELPYPAARSMDWAFEQSAASPPKPSSSLTGPHSCCCFFLLSTLFLLQQKPAHLPSAGVGAWFSASLFSASGAGPSHPPADAVEFTHSRGTGRCGLTAP